MKYLVMKNAMRKLLYISIVLGILSCSDVFAAYPGDFNENGVFLAHSYVVYPDWVSKMSTLAPAMVSYKCNYWFVNVGLLTSSGVITSPSSQLAQVVPFLNAVKAYETANNCHFILIAYINANKSSTDLSSSSLRSAIVGECKKFVSTTVRSSYVYGATRTFDGITMDIEPCGNDDTYFNNYKTLMDEIRASFDSLGLYSKTTAVCSLAYGSSSSQWQWSAAYYYNMAKHVNFLQCMTYDSESTSASAYQTWISNQTYNILRAVSGKYWNNSNTYPPPTNGVKVFIGFPAYGASSNHNPAYENIRYAANGTLTGISNLQAGSDPSVNYFLGGAVFSHTDGTGSDGRASFTTDWPLWIQYWLTPPAMTDITRDGIVNFYDFSVFAEHWLVASGNSLDDERYDYNHDDVISIIDLDYISKDWLTTGGQY